MGKLNIDDGSFDEYIEQKFATSSNYKGILNKFDFEIENFINSVCQSLHIEEGLVVDLKHKLIEFQQIRLKRKDDAIAKKLNQVLDISNRYLMIRDLWRNQESNNFGLFGLLFYLGLTCFDSLGQKKNNITFYEWLTSNKNDNAKAFFSSDLLAERNLKCELEKLNKDYVENYGTKKSFFHSFDRIADKESYKNLMSNIEFSPRVQKGNNLEDLEEVKIVWLFQFRNNFTHNSKNWRLPIDKDYTKSEFSYGTKKLDITIQTENLLNSLLECILDGLRQIYDDVIKDFQ